jgi:Flp pilus assembly protein TadG
MNTMLLRFRDDTRGSVFTMVAVASLAVIGSVGLAVDVGRSQMVESKLQSAVDAAGLAAGASLSTTDINALATKYITLNFTQGILGATLGTVTSSISPNNQVITLTANATLPTTFMKIFDQNVVNISATTEVTRSNKGLEVVMVLDTTGSMAGTKIASLKTAAHDLVGILFGTDTTSPNLWIGMVPFSQTVNIGTGRSAWLLANAFDWGPTSWMGCVEARYATGRDMTDDPPSVEKFRAYYWADHDTKNNWITSNSPLTYSLDTVGTSQRGPNAYCSAPVLGMVNVRATIDTAIDTIFPAGNTHVNYGAVWGWRMLSPRWRGLWGGLMNTNNLPLDYNTPLMQKAIIIMTDGTNTMSNNVDSAYGYLSDNQLGTTNNAAAVTALNTKLTTVCNALKAQNVVVYTVLFQETDATIMNLLRNCATTPDYFFDSPTDVELQTAFRAIGDSLANLRISR